MRTHFTLQELASPSHTLTHVSNYAYTNKNTHDRGIIQKQFDGPSVIAVFCNSMLPCRSTVNFRQTGLQQHLSKEIVAETKCEYVAVSTTPQSFCTWPLGWKHTYLKGSYSLGKVPAVETHGYTEKITGVSEYCVYVYM